MKRTFSITFAALGWFAVVAQYFIMMENRVESPVETTIRFFTFFTILTNILVATYFTLSALNPNPERTSFIGRPGALTAITLYITIVGLVYQIVLRQIWEPHGLQKIVDELLHSVIPVLTLVYWYLYEQKSDIKFRQIGSWLIYPGCYLLFILARGSFSDFYPYPFIDVLALGYKKVVLNSIVMLGVFVAIAFLLVGLGRRVDGRDNFGKI
jgi:hypothetical protein